MWCVLFAVLLPAATGPQGPWMLEACFGCHLSIVVLLPNVNEKGEVKLLCNFFWCLKGCDGRKIVSIVLIIREGGKRERERERGRERERKISAKNSISCSLPIHASMFLCCNTKRAIIIVRFNMITLGFLFGKGYLFLEVYSSPNKTWRGD